MLHIQDYYKKKVTYSFLLSNHNLFYCLPSSKTSTFVSIKCKLYGKEKINYRKW